MGPVYNLPASSGQPNICFPHHLSLTLILWLQKLRWNFENYLACKVCCIVILCCAGPPANAERHMFRSVIRIVQRFLDTYHISNRPVVHSEAAEARDNHRVVPLPLYDTTGKLIGFRYWCPCLCQLYPHSLWFIPALGSNDAANTFVADIKSLKILVDTLPLRNDSNEGLQGRNQ